MKRIAIIGLGLIGGSLGLAIKNCRGSEATVVGCARRDEVGKQAIERGAIDISESAIDQAVQGADIVIIATPIMAMKSMFQRMADYLSPTTIVTDVGSTKVQVM